MSSQSNKARLLNDLAAGTVGGFVGTAVNTPYVPLPRFGHTLAYINFVDLMYVDGRVGGEHLLTFGINRS